jgi:signal transduction histidine kinase
MTHGIIIATFHPANDLESAICRRMTPTADAPANHRQTDYFLNRIISICYRIDGARMFIRGLKTKIAINMAVLLLLGMISIDLVTMMTARRDLIRAEISKANQFLATVAEHLHDSSWQGGGKTAMTSRAGIHALVSAAESATLLVLDREERQIVFGPAQDALSSELHRNSRAALRSGESDIRFTGSAWGVFWPRKSHLIVSIPASRNDEIIAGVTVAWPLAGVYASLRNSQKFLFLYIVINAALLTFFGIYRVFKLYLQPLSRLARRAEEYREDDDILFAVRKEDNELNRLSTALNGMLRRMSADKAKLRSMVASLEKANTELKAAQQEIIRAEKLASVGRLSAGIAHEIGNPIGIVMGYLELLKQEGTTAAEQHEYIQRTEKEISRIHKIIAQLLQISRPSQTGPENVAVHDLLADIVEVFKVQPLTANIEFQCDFQATEDVVTADSNQLRQVFLNLIINAADAIASNGKGANGTVSVSTEILPCRQMASGKQARGITIQFKDNGPGISEQDLGNIFDPFFTTKEPGKGTGLGLSVSFMIIERFGGDISVESQPGSGTAISIHLPLQAAQASAEMPVN